MALCLGATESIGQDIRIGSNDGVKIDTGDTRVDLNPDGNVSVRVPKGQVDADAPEPSPREDEGQMAEHFATGEMTENGTQISLMGTGQSQTVTCKKGGEVSIEGNSNTYRIVGECKRVSVSGTSNKVRVESVGRVTVQGVGNVVTWERTLGSAKKPKISTEGVNNKVSQAR
jgi:hypothetical protein